MKSLGVWSLKVYQPTEFEDNIIFLSLQSLSVNDKFLNLMQALDSHVLTALTKFVFMSFKLTLYRYVRHYVCMTDKPPRLSSVNKSIIIIIIITFL